MLSSYEPRAFLPWLPYGDVSRSYFAGYPTCTFEIIKCTFPIFTFFPLSYLVVGVGTQVIGNSGGVSAASASDLVLLTSVDGMSEVFSMVAPWLALLPCTMVGWLLVR